MIKQTPSVGKVAAMVVFALTCVGVLLFLWLSFGGPVPLKPKGYEVSVDFPEATTLAEQADVRIAGVSVGKVTKKTLDKRGAATKVTLQIDQRFAPIAKDTRAILRQKTLFGETYVELAPGDPSRGKLKDGGMLARSNVEKTVELDEIFSAFDKPTKEAFRHWVQESGKSIQGRGQDLNDALGNLQGFAQDGASVLDVLDRQNRDLHDVVKNTGVVFGALNRRYGALHDVIVNSDRVFAATASRDKALAETFQIFPTFLDESKATLARLEDFSRNTHPLVNDLKPSADRLGPTVRDVSVLAPELTTLFRDRLDPLISVAKPNLPNAQRFLDGAGPLMDGLHTFLPELNPILSFVNYDQQVLTNFLSVGAAATRYQPEGKGPNGEPLYALSQFGVITPRSLGLNQTQPPTMRGNAYLAPNAYQRGASLGVPAEAWDCSNAGGEQRHPVDETNSGSAAPGCYVAGPLLFDNKYFPRLQRGNAPFVPPPQGTAGKKKATP
jgi:phospholipid/cholesterol/gamma-HCH transport system substrate-binding protein